MEQQAALTWTEQLESRYFSILLLHRERSMRMHKKRYEELGFTEDFMFGKVMEDKELCRDVLERLLEKRVKELQDVQTERGFQHSADGKPVRLDVYTKDQQTVYDAEMQNLNHKSLGELALPKRSRFYQSTMDMDFLEKGHSYRELPYGIIIFLCTFDPFRMGKAKYAFRNSCDTDGNLLLGDGTEKIFFNCTCPLEEVPENLRTLFDFIINEKVGDELTAKLATALNNARKNEKWGSEYMKELLHEDDVRTDAFAEGRSEGLIESRRETANNMYKNHFTIEQIALALNENRNVIEDWVGAIGDV